MVYDFAPGRRFPGEEGLEDWFARFQNEFPPPSGAAKPLDPGVLAGLDSGFRMGPAARFEVALHYEPASYLESALTETNVAEAVRLGAPLAVIRGWCAATLRPVWRGKRSKAVFEGYDACMEAAGGC